MHTNTPQVVVGIEEPRTLRLTARTLSYQTGFLLSAMNTQYEEVGINGRNPMCRFSPKCHGHTHTVGNGVQSGPEYVQNMSGLG